MPTGKWPPCMLFLSVCSTVVGIVSKRIHIIAIPLSDRASSLILPHYIIVNEILRRMGLVDLENLQFLAVVIYVGGMWNSFSK